MKQLLLVPYILALVTAAPYDIVVKLGGKDQASATPSNTLANSSATALQAPPASPAWTMFNTTLSTPAQTVQTNPAALPVAAPALAPAYGPVASPVPASAYTVPGSAPGLAPASAQAHGTLSAVNPSSSASGGAPVPVYDPASAVAPANNTYYSSPTATTQPAANSNNNNNNNNNNIVSYPSSSTNYDNIALTSVQQPSLLYNNTPSVPATAPSSSVSTSPADSTGSPLVAPVSTPPETNITINFDSTSYSASAPAAAPAPPPSPISYTYVNQTPPYMKEAASPGALTDNSPPPPQVPPAPSVYPSPVPSPALPPSPAFSPDSTHKAGNTTSSPSLSPDSSANPSSTAEALFPVLNNSLIVVRLPPENVTSQDNDNGAPSQLSQHAKAAQRPSANVSTVTNMVNTLNGSALPGSVPSGLHPAASDSTNSVITNIQPHNRTADVGNNLPETPAAVSELITGSHVASAKNDKVDASSNHDKTSTKPTFLHIQIAPLASSSDSSNTSKSKDNSTASTMTSSSASVTEQRQHNVQVSPKSANASKGILDSSVSASAVVQLGLQETKSPLSVHHINPPAKATPPKQKEEAAGKWGFGDKYLASQNQRARHRNVMFDGIAGDPSSFSNYQVLGHQDLLFKRSAEREKRDEEATATE